MKFNLFYLKQGGVQLECLQRQISLGGSTLAYVFRTDPNNPNIFPNLFVYFQETVGCPKCACYMSISKSLKSWLGSTCPLGTFWRRRQSKSCSHEEKLFLNNSRLDIMIIDRRKYQRFSVVLTSRAMSSSAATSVCRIEWFPPTRCYNFRHDQN